MAYLLINKPTQRPWRVGSGCQLLMKGLFKLLSNLKRIKRYELVRKNWFAPH
jgi:hypothetical protein